MTVKRNAVITGSTSGIGLGIAESFAAEGWSVMLNGFGDADEIEKTRAALEKNHGVTVHYNGADMTKPEEIRGAHGGCRGEVRTSRYPRQ